MNLGELITALEAANPEQPVAHGFGNPHSYRGDYMELAFEPVDATTVRAMLDAARSAVDATFQGYKGGDFLMTSDTWCWLSEYGDASGETISPQMVAWMLTPNALTPCTCRQMVHAREHGGRTVDGCPWCMPAPGIRPGRTLASPAVQDVPLPAQEA